MDEFLQELKQSLNANAVRTIERLEEKHKASLDFARAAVELAEKMNVCDLVNENARLQKELRFLKAQSGPESVKKKDLQAVPPSFVPQEDMYIHCRTDEQANALLEHLDKLGFCWASTQPLSEKSYFHFHKEETCYGVYPESNAVTYTSCESVNPDRPIINFENIEAYMKLKDSELARQAAAAEREER